MSEPRKKIKIEGSDYIHGDRSVMSGNANTIDPTSNKITLTELRKFITEAVMVKHGKRPVQNSIRMISRNGNKATVGFKIREGGRLVKCALVMTKEMCREEVSAEDREKWEGKIDREFQDKMLAELKSGQFTADLGAMKSFDDYVTFVAKSMSDCVAAIGYILEIGSFEAVQYDSHNKLLEFKFKASPKDMLKVTFETSFFNEVPDKMHGYVLNAMRERGKLK